MAYITALEILVFDIFLIKCVGSYLLICNSVDLSYVHVCCLEKQGELCTIVYKSGKMIQINQICPAGPLLHATVYVVIFKWLNFRKYGKLKISKKYF